MSYPVRGLDGVLGVSNGMLGPGVAVGTACVAFPRPVRCVAFVTGGPEGAAVCPSSVLVVAECGDVVEGGGCVAASHPAWGVGVGS